MNYKEYFAEAEKLGLDPYQISFSLSEETDVEVFNDEVESQEIGSTQGISAIGILDGKKGSFSTDCIDRETPELLARQVYESARYGKEARKEDYFAGGLKYHRSLFSKKNVVPATLKELRDFALDYSKRVSSYSPLIKKTNVSLCMVKAKSEKINSLGLKCSDTGLYFSCSVEIIAENDSHEPRSNYKSFWSMTSLEDLKSKSEEVIPELVSVCIDFFGSMAEASKKYKIVFSPSCTATLLSYYLSQLNAKKVQKHLSAFEGKMNTKIASANITLKNMPFLKKPGNSIYDADGYPTKEFTFIEKGVLKDYFYSVESANADHRKSNGCASGDGNGSPILVSMKPGRLSQDGLFHKMKDGLYIKSLEGLNSGINGQTLDFSLPCSGYVIKDGVKGKAFSMMVVAGNVKDVFENVISVGNDISERFGRYIPSILIRPLMVSGD